MFTYIFRCFTIGNLIRQSFEGFLPTICLIKINHIERACMPCQVSLPCYLNLNDWELKSMLALSTYPALICAYPVSLPYIVLMPADVSWVKITSSICAMLGRDRSGQLRGVRLMGRRKHHRLNFENRASIRPDPLLWVHWAEGIIRWGYMFYGSLWKFQTSLRFWILLKLKRQQYWQNAV